MLTFPKIIKKILVGVFLLFLLPIGISQASLINCYIFDNNVSDSCGSNNGTLAGTPNPTVSVGYFNLSSGKSAYDFDGDNGTTDGDRSRIQYNITDFQYTATDSFTFNIWTKVNWSGVTNTAYLFHIGQAGQAGITEINTREATDGIRFNLQDTSSNSIFFDSPALTDNKWTMVTYVYNNKVVSMYIDGLFIDSRTNAGFTGNFYSGNAKVQLGARWVTGADYDFDLKGVVGGLRHYDEALIATQIRNLYGRGRKTFN